MKSESKIRLDLAQNIRRIRKEKGLTQERLAELADISNTYVANIERGKTWVSDYTLEKIAAALGVSTYYLFIPEKNFSNELERDSQALLTKILLATEKELNTNLAATIKQSLKEIREAFDV